MEDERKTPQEDKEFNNIANRLFGIEKELDYIKICFMKIKNSDFLPAGGQVYLKKLQYI